MQEPYREEQAYDIRDSLAGLCAAEIALQQFDAAQANCKHVIEMDRQMLGESHPQTAADTINLASLKLTLRQISEAEELYRKGIQAMTAWYGADNPDVITAEGFLGKTLSLENKRAEAKTILQKVLASQEAVYGPAHDRVAFTLNSLGEIAYRDENWSEAQSDYEKAAVMERALLGETDIHTTVYESNLANVYMKQGRYAPAEAILRRVVDIQSKLPPGNVLIAVTRTRWGKALVGLHRYAEAEIQLTQAYQLLRNSKHPSGEQLRAVSEELIQLYKLLDQPLKAKAIEAEVMAASAHSDTSASLR
jgi:tetratricopeptide (TPR) repeat protein